MNGRRVTSKDCFFDTTDGYDFCSKKRSLKKWERELGITHKYTSLPWDPVWHKIAVWIRRSFRRFDRGYYGRRWKEK